MKGLNLRQKKLIHLLVQNESYLPVAFYSEKLGKSNRTIYSDLEKIQTFLKNESLVLEKKPRIGIQLQGTISDKMQLLEKIKDTTVEVNSETQNRQCQIAKQLLIDDEIVTQQKLAQHFHVSPSSIVSDLEKIVERYRVTLIASKRGTHIICSEEDIKNRFFRFC